ncbi:MAG: YicC family protein [Gemmatimonadota bacterium]|nr:YicC family protein [Gemmatimonadota bacterium]MDE2984099.1 YicC family protein [Gemmatimonadota bacterium]
MIRSMTGYGAGESGLSDGRVLRAEVRTVNHRHLSTSVRLPRGWEGLERSVLERIRSALSRGSVSLAVRCESPGREEDGEPVLDLERARRYVELMYEAGSELGVEGHLDIEALARLPGVLRMEGPPAAEPDEQALGACVEAALGEVVAMREAEGRRLEVELRAGLGRILDEVAAIEEAAPARLLRERDRLRERVAALSEGVEVDEDRLAREIAYLAERWDIAEEIVRLRSHVALFGEGLGGGGAGGKAGKRLGFVVQEMHREANTVGSKANDAAISASAIAIKEELERIREQLENVE